MSQSFGDSKTSSHPSLPGRDNCLRTSSGFSLPLIFVLSIPCPDLVRVHNHSSLFRASRSAWLKYCRLQSLPFPFDRAGFTRPLATLLQKVRCETPMCLAASSAVSNLAILPSFHFLLHFSLHLLAHLWPHHAFHLSVRGHETQKAAPTCPVSGFVLQFSKPISWA